MRSGVLYWDTVKVDDGDMGACDEISRAISLAVVRALEIFAERSAR